MVNAQGILDDLDTKKIKIRKRKSTVSYRGIPLETIKGWRTSKIKRLTIKLKGGKK